MLPDAAATSLYFWDEVDTPGHFTAHAGRLYFSAVESDFPGVGVEPWVSDGTPGGTGRLADIFPGAEGSSSYGLTVASRKLYFAADDGEHGHEPWKVFPGPWARRPEPQAPSLARPPSSPAPAATSSSPPSPSSAGRC